MPWEDIPSSGGFEDIKDTPGPSEWESANVPVTLESAAQRQAKPKESLLQTIVRKSKERSEQTRKKGILQTLKEAAGNIPLDPGSMLAQSYNQMVDYLPDDTLPKAPVVNLAGVAKGYTDLPVGISRRLYSHLAPGSPEAQAAGQMASSIEEESENYEPSMLGQMAGQALFSAPLRIPQAASTLGKLATGAATGAGYGLAQPRGEIKDEGAYRETALPSAAYGAMAGAATELPGMASRALPYLKDPRRALAEARAKVGQGEARKVFQSELETEKVSRINELNKQFEDALTGAEGIKPNVKPILDAIDTNLEKLSPAIEQDKPLINRLVSLRDRVQSAQPVQEAPMSRYDQLLKEAMDARKAEMGTAEVTPDLSVRGLTQWRRLVGQRQQAAFDTAGNAVQVTPSVEHGNMIRSIKNAIDESIEQASPEVAAKLRAARGSWQERMGPFISDELGQAPVERMMKTSTPDVEMKSMIETPSGDLAKRFLDASTPRARASVQTEVLDSALQNRATDGPVGFYKTVLDKHGNLNPALGQFFQGEDAAMLIGAAKIARAADKLGIGTNMALGAGAAAIPGSAMFGASGGAIGGVGGLAGVYAGRRLIPNFTAGWWESAIRNPGTRGLLTILSKLPQDSPEFQKLATQAATQQQAKPNEDWE